MDLTLLILAAGMGSRYGGLKQLDAVGPGGETIMDYSIYDAVRAGFNKVVFVIRRDMEDAFREHVGTKPVEMDFAFQELDMIPPAFTVPEERTKPWGTAHAILAAADKLNGPFAVINADDFYGQEAFQTLADQLSRPEQSDVPEYCMVGFVLKQTLSPHGSVSRGVCKMDSTGHLSDTAEHTDIHDEGGRLAGRDENDQPVVLSGGEIVSMNCWGFPQEFLKQTEEIFTGFLEQNIHTPNAEFYIPSVINQIISDGSAKVKVLKTSSIWFGVTYKEDKAFVEENIRKLIDEGAYPESLWA